MAKAFVRLGSDGYRTEIITRAHITHADESISDGGTDTGPDPIEMLLGALGSCMAITTHMYARRKGWPLESIEFDLEVERYTAADYPAYQGDAQFVHEVRNQMQIHGPLDAEQRKRLMEIAGKCPVHRILATPTFFIENLVNSEIAPSSAE